MYLILQRCLRTRIFYIPTIVIALAICRSGFAETGCEEWSQYRDGQFYSDFEAEWDRHEANYSVSSESVALFQLLKEELLSDIAYESRLS